MPVSRSRNKSPKHAFDLGKMEHRSPTNYTLTQFGNILPTFKDIQGVCLQFLYQRQKNCWDAKINSFNVMFCVCGTVAAKMFMYGLKPWTNWVIGSNIFKSGWRTVKSWSQHLSINLNRYFNDMQSDGRFSRKKKVLQCK